MREFGGLIAARRRTATCPTCGQSIRLLTLTTVTPKLATHNITPGVNCAGSLKKVTT